MVAFRVLIAGGVRPSFSYAALRVALDALLASRPPSPSPDLDWGWWAWTAYDSALAVVDYRNLTNMRCPKPSVYGPARLDDPCGVHHYWSLHPGGGNWVFGDGSVRFLRNGIPTDPSQ